MQAEFVRSLGRGTERLMAWADVLDRINVFPVADGDTGRNLVLSLSPILRGATDARELTESLLLSARGNSGNLASRFLSGFIDAGAGASLSDAAQRGNSLAWQAVEQPVRGTMLSFFEALCAELESHPPESGAQWIDEVLRGLEWSVLQTTEELPVLDEAGVVDSGALGMFIFFDGFLNALAGREERMRPVAQLFGTRLEVDAGWEIAPREGCCIDAVVRAEGAGSEAALRGLGESAVTMRHGSYVKVHVHADDALATRARMAALGEVVTWAADRLGEQSRRFRATATRRSPIHLVTDAAGTLTRADAAELGVTLLDSYINFGRRSVPETHMDPAELYAMMRSGAAVSTSQASDFERHQHYQKLLALYPRVLYVCVGSAFTQNVQTVTEWKRHNDPQGALAVIDSGAASGRLGLVVIATARMALAATTAEAVVAFAEEAVRSCEEYVFLDRLSYLAAGGRLSKTSAFFGDMLRMKPVVSPLPEGAKKITVVHDAREQVSFAMERLERSLAPAAPALLMLEHTDNEEWVREVPAAAIERRFPRAEILVRPMSLTSGTHMGPGTWGVAFLPEKAK